MGRRTGVRAASAAAFTLLCSTGAAGSDDIAGIPNVPIHEFNIQARGMTFRATECGRGGEKGNVLLLHGFPFWMTSWHPLMKYLCDDGWHCLAYDQRGYSPEASPDGVENYHYDELRDDVVGVADAVGFQEFNLVAHDHGAVLGYYVVDHPSMKERVKTFSALTIPHLNVFSAAVSGEADELDEAQEYASQYFQMFIADDSATVGNNFLFNVLGAGFESPAVFQKALWWYNGAIAAGVMGFPRLRTPQEIEEKFGSNSGNFIMRNAFAGAIPGEVAAKKQTTQLGKVSMPFLYAIGSDDDAILGFEPWALATRDLAGSTYTEVIINGDHNIMSTSGPSYMMLYRTILGHIEETSTANVARRAPENENPVSYM